MLEQAFWVSIAFGVAVALVSLIVLYLVIFLAVRSALRSHAGWVADEAAFRQAAGGSIIRDV